MGINLKDEIGITYYSFDINLAKKEKCDELIELLKKLEFFPFKYGSGEQAKFNYESNAFTKFWLETQGSVFIKGSNFWASINADGKKPYSSNFNINYKKIGDWLKIIELSKEFYRWYNAFYLYCGIWQYCRVYSPGYSKAECLGGICWLNIFAKPYVDMWGKDKINKAPTYKTEWLDDGSVVLITAESPITDRKIAESAEDKLKEYLGLESFYSDVGEKKVFTPQEFVQQFINSPSKKKYKVPDFTKYYDYDPKKEDEKLKKFMEDQMK